MCSVQQLAGVFQMYQIDTESEMNEFFEVHMEDVVAKFKHQAPEYKIEMMKKIKELAEDFLEYYGVDE